MRSKLPLLPSGPHGVRKSAFHGPWQIRVKFNSVPPFIKNFQRKSLAGTMQSVGERVASRRRLSPRGSVGETPTGATGTVAVPISTAALRLGFRKSGCDHSNRSNRSVPTNLFAAHSALRLSPPLSCNNISVRNHSQPFKRFPLWSSGLNALAASLTSSMSSQSTTKCHSPCSARVVAPTELRPPTA